MDRLMVSQAIAGMMAGLSFGVVGFGGSEFKRKSRYSASHIHPTKSGAGRSKGMKRKQNNAGRKLATKAFNGMCGIRGNVGAAGRLALEGKLCKQYLF